MEQKEKDQKIEQVKEILKTMEVDFLDHSVIQDNKLYFTHNNESYRVLMPSPKDLSDAENIRHQHYGQFLVIEGYYLKDVLKKILKEKQGIDIDALEQQKEEVSNRLKQAYLNLADLGTSKEKTQIDEKKEKINKIQNELININTEIVNYLSPCIEDQVEKKYVEYLTFLCTEKLVDRSSEKYEKVWTDFTVFETDNTQLAIKAINRLTQLLLDSREVL